MIGRRGPCGHQLAQLDPELGIIVCKCRLCSFDAREVALHALDARSGADLDH